MSPQWQDFAYLVGSALKDRANRGRTDSFGNALSRVQALNTYIGPDGRVWRKY